MPDSSWLKKFLKKVIPANFRYINLKKRKTRQPLHLLGLTGILYLFCCKSQVICNIANFLFFVNLFYYFLLFLFRFSVFFLTNSMLLFSIQNYYSFLR